jgi:hypothetical protein
MKKNLHTRICKSPLSEFNKLLTAKLHGFKPANSVTLLSDDLRLPDEANRHEAHEEDTNGKSQICVRLTGWQTQTPKQPRHV